MCRMWETLGTLFRMNAKGKQMQIDVPRRWIDSCSTYFRCITMNALIIETEGRERVSSVVCILALNESVDKSKK